MRIFNLNCQYSDTKKLENVSLLIEEGDRVGFYGLSQSGKDFFLSLISGKEEVDIRNLHLYLEGKRVTDLQQAKRFFYWMAPPHYHFSWTVAEYVFLKESSWLRLKKQEERLFLLAEECFGELNIDIDVSKKISELTELEKRVVELVRAWHYGASIVVVEDEFEGMPREEIQRFSRILTRIQAETKMAVIVNSHSELVMSVLSQRCIIFKSGRIEKKEYHQNRFSSGQMEKYLLGQTMRSRKKSLEAYSRESRQGTEESDETVYSVEYVRRQDKRTMKFDFRKGKITTLLLNHNEEKEKLFEFLAGWEDEAELVRKVDGTVIRESGIQNMMNNRVVGIRYLGGKEDIFSNMTVTDNLILPSLRKVSRLQYMLHSIGLAKSIYTMQQDSDLNLKQKIAKLETDERIEAILQRWYIYNPKVLILLEPFVNCDVYGVSIVKNYLRKFASRETSVIILKSREEYIEDLSDEIIFCE